MSPKNARVVFWDFDETPATRNETWSGALARALNDITGTQTSTAADFDGCLSTGFSGHRPDVVRPVSSASEWWDALAPVFFRACESAGVTGPTATRAVSAIPGEYYRVSAWKLRSGARPALTQVAAAGYRNVVLSNHGAELPNLADELGLMQFVDTVVTSATVGAEKPNPQIFRHALHLSDAGDDVWMVGDNPIADIEGAEAVGMKALLIGPDRTLLDAADIIVSAAAHAVSAD